MIIYAKCFKQWPQHMVALGLPWKIYGQNESLGRQCLSMHTHCFFLDKLVFYLSDLHLVLAVSLGVSTTASQPFLMCMDWHWGWEQRVRRFLQVSWWIPHSLKEMPYLPDSRSGWGVRKHNKHGAGSLRTELKCLGWKSKQTITKAVLVRSPSCWINEPLRLNLLTHWLYGRKYNVPGNLIPVQNNPNSYSQNYVYTVTPSRTQELLGAESKGRNEWAE